MKAEDGSYIGAYSGAAAVNWQQGKAAQVTKRGKDTVLDSASGGAGETTQVTTPEAPTTQKTVVKNKDGSVTTYDGGHATAAISGAIALNIDDQAVTSELSGVTITDAARVQNIAQKDGALVAAGLGLAATKKNNEGQSAFDATARSPSTRRRMPSTRPSKAARLRRKTASRTSRTTATRRSRAARTSRS